MTSDDAVTSWERDEEPWQLNGLKLSVICHGMLRGYDGWADGGGPEEEEDDGPRPLTTAGSTQRATEKIAPPRKAVSRRTFRAPPARVFSSGVLRLTSAQGETHKLAQLPPSPSAVNQPGSSTYL